MSMLSDAMEKEDTVRLKAYVGPFEVAEGGFEMVHSYVAQISVELENTMQLKVRIDLLKFVEGCKGGFGVVRLYVAQSSAAQVSALDRFSTA
jgi:hypothetical protein